MLGRRWDPAGRGPLVVAVDRDGVHDLSAEAGTVSELLERDDRVEVVRRAVAGAPSWRTDEVVEPSLARDGSRPRFLAPVDLQVIKACGVTFVDSMIERVIEERVGGDPARAAEARERITAVSGGRSEEQTS